MPTHHDMTPLDSQIRFVRACEEKLRAQHSLLVITGAPGAGKSTVLHAMDAEGHARPVVDLRHVLDEAGMLSAIAEALDLHHEPPRERPDTDPRRAQIIEALSDPEAPRLRVDHAAHLHGPLVSLCAELADTPHTPIVLASRRSLGFGERMEIEPLTDEDAYTLCLASAPASRRSSLESQRDELIELAHALEHNPLAIKLCASRLGLFKPGDILARQTSQRGSSTHGSLAEAFAWSWELLDARQKDDLTRCATCTGWFDAELVAPMMQTDQDDARARLEALRDHSLLEAERAADTTRYRMAKPLIHFIEQMARPLSAQAREALATHVASRALELHRDTLGNRWHITPELLTEVLATHILPALQWWRSRWSQDPGVHVLERVVESLLGAHLLLWQRQDFERLRTLHDWIESELSGHALCAHLDVELRVRLVCIRTDYCTLLYDIHRARELMNELALDELPEELELLCLVRLAEFEPQLHAEHAQAHIDRGLELARRLEHFDAQASLLLAHARMKLETQRTEEAIDAFAQAEAFTRQRPRQRALARVLIFQGYTLHQAGRRQEEANALIDEARELFIAHEDIIGAAHALRVRAWHSVDDRDFAHSAQLIEETIEMGTRYGLGWMHAFGYFLLGQHELDQQHYVQAQVAYERARYHLERHRIMAMLAASLLYRSICYKLTGDMEMARRIFEEGYGHFDAVHSLTGKAHYMCERAEWLATDGERASALETIGLASELVGGAGEQDLLHAIVEVYACRVDLIHYFTLREQGAPTSPLYKHILERLSTLHVPREGSERRLLDSCIEMRLAWAQLERELPEEFMRRFLVELQDPQARALLIDARARAYRAPTEYAWVSLGKKENPYNLLLLLVEHHLSSPGEPVDDAAIMAHLWPDEIIAPQAAKNRLHVTLSSLRNSGQLKPHILSHPDGGYMLAEQLDIYEV